MGLVLVIVELPWLLPLLLDQGPGQAQRYLVLLAATAATLIVVALAALHKP